MYNVDCGKVIAPDHATKRRSHAGRRERKEIKERPSSDPLSENESAVPWQSSVNLQLLIPRVGINEHDVMSMHLGYQDV